MDLDREEGLVLGRVKAKEVAQFSTSNLSFLVRPLTKEVQVLAQQA